eukprot:167276_1
MMSVIILLLCIAVCNSSPLWQTELGLSSLDLVNTTESFDEWSLIYQKQYSSIDEESHHYITWLDNLHYIAQQNSLYLNYKLRLNQFSDLTEDEFRTYVHGKDGACFRAGSIPKLVDDDIYNIDDTLSAPDSVDWSTKGVVTPVKNQGSCGSCWAFSATGSLECRYAIKTGSLNSLSEQELVDCAGSKYDSYGCNGGEENGGMQYAADNKGLCSEKDYAYTAHNGACKTGQCTKRYNANTGVRYVDRYNSTGLVNEVVNGCVSIAIDAGGAFQHYSSGVIDGVCGVSIDHAILTVGYGVDPSSGQKYWKVKNSWGQSWGEAGYARICRDCHKNGPAGECGILMWPSIALF